MAEFFDIFNHRLISLFYRAWAKYRFFIGYESGEQDMLTPKLMDFLGLGTPGLKSRTSYPRPRVCFLRGPAEQACPHRRGAEANS